MFEALLVLPLQQFSLLCVDSPLVEPNVLTEDVLNEWVLLQDSLLLNAEQLTALVVRLDHSINKLVEQSRLIYHAEEHQGLHQ
jgi:hypothetical protein